MMSFLACHLPSNASEVAFWPSRDIFPPKRHPRIRYCVFPHSALKDNFLSFQGIVKVKCVTSSHLVGIFRFLCYKALIFVLKMYVSNALWIRLGEFLKKSTRPRAGQMAFTRLPAFGLCQSVFLALKNDSVKNLTLNKYLAQETSGMLNLP